MTSSFCPYKVYIKLVMTEHPSYLFIILTRNQECWLSLAPMWAVGCGWGFSQVPARVRILEWLFPCVQFSDQRISLPSWWRLRTQNHSKQCSSSKEMLCTSCKKIVVACIKAKFHGFPEECCIVVMWVIHFNCELNVSVKWCRAPLVWECIRNLWSWGEGCGLPSLAVLQHNPGKQKDHKGGQGGVLWKNSAYC